MKLKVLALHRRGFPMNCTSRPDDRNAVNLFKISFFPWILYSNQTSTRGGKTASGTYLDKDAKPKSSPARMNCLAVPSGLRMTIIEHKENKTQVISNELKATDGPTG